MDRKTIVLIVWMLFVAACAVGIFLEASHSAELEKCKAWAKGTNEGAVCTTDKNCWEFEKNCWQKFGISGPITLQDCNERFGGENEY